MDSLSYVSAANNCAVNELCESESNVKSETHHETSEDTTYHSTNQIAGVHLCEVIERQDIETNENKKDAERIDENKKDAEKKIDEDADKKIFRLTEIIPPDGTYKKEHIAVFPVWAELLYSDNISVSPEFTMSDVTWSVVFYPNGFNKDNLVFIDLGIQIKSYKILYKEVTEGSSQDSGSSKSRPEPLNRYIIFTISILSEGEDFFVRKTERFSLTPRGQRYDGYMIFVEDFGDKNVLGALANEEGIIKFRVEMEMARELSELEKVKQFYSWIHINWMVRKNEPEEWQRVLDALNEEQCRMAESFRVTDLVNEAQIKVMDHLINVYIKIFQHVHQLNTINAAQEAASLSHLPVLQESCETLMDEKAEDDGDDDDDKK